MEITKFAPWIKSARGKMTSIGDLAADPSHNKQDWSLKKRK